jgi:hypothetical protein
MKIGNGTLPCGFAKEFLCAMNVLVGKKCTRAPDPI